MPFLTTFYGLFGGSGVTGITHTGVAVSYGAKSFADRNASAEGETVVLMVAIADLEAFSDFELSEEQFIEKSVVLLKDAGGKFLRRVELEIK